MCAVTDMGPGKRGGGNAMQNIEQPFDERHFAENDQFES